MLLCDPNFFGASPEGKRVPFIFELNGTKAEFNSSDLGDKTSQIISYDLPFEKFPEFDEQIK